MAKLNFQHHYSSLHCHMIHQKSFEYADLLLKKHFLSILKTVVVLDILWKIWFFFTNADKQMLSIKLNFYWIQNIPWTEMAQALMSLYSSKSHLEYLHIHDPITTYRHCRMFSQCSLCHFHSVAFGHDQLYPIWFQHKHALKSCCHTWMSKTSSLHGSMRVRRLWERKLNVFGVQHFTRPLSISNVHWKSLV